VQFTMGQVLAQSHLGEFFYDLLLGAALLFRYVFDNGDKFLVLQKNTWRSHPMSFPHQVLNQTPKKRHDADYIRTNVLGQEHRP